HANPVYALVRDCLRDAGLDRERFGSPAWNPFGGHIRRGQRVFVLCNFVTHRRAHESADAFTAKCTHGSVLRAVLDYVLIAAGETGTVTFGNAPLQSCRWDAVLEETGAASVLDFYRQRNQPVSAADLRGYAIDQSRLGSIRSVEQRRDAGIVEVDLGARSRLERGAESAHSRFRVSDYDPRATGAFHGPARHVYALNRRVLEADVIVSVPKLKTHEKVGIT